VLVYLGVLPAQDEVCLSKIYGKLTDLIDYDFYNPGSVLYA